MNQKFFVDRRNVKNINTLKFQACPVTYPALSVGEDKVEENRLVETFAEEDSWYYEMCTGTSLCIAISSFLLSIKKTRPDINAPWNKHRLRVFHRLLESFRVQIVACPATYWRISVIEKIFFAINEELLQRRNATSSQGITQYLSTNLDYASIPATEDEWYNIAQSEFHRIFNNELLNITRKSGLSDVNQYAISFIEGAVDYHKELCVLHKAYCKKDDKLSKSY